MNPDGKIEAGDDGGKWLGEFLRNNTKHERENRMDKKVSSLAGNIVREPVSQEIIQFAVHLADMSAMLAARVNDKLSPVMLSLPQPTVAEVVPPPTREYPPLFEELKAALQVIEKSLQNIENAISRTEL